MINGNAPEVAAPVGAAWRTVRDPDPSLHGFSHSDARRAAARSRELHEHVVSNAELLSWNGRRQAVAHGPGTVRCRERVIERRDRGQER